MSLFSFLPAFSTTTVFLITGIVLYIVQYVRTKFRYWSDRGVPTISGLLSAKAFLQVLLGRSHATEFYHKIYKSLEGRKFGASYQGLEPALFLKDPELIKQILIKGFSNFHDRQMPQANNPDDPFSENLFGLTGNKWRQVRHKLSPGFSSAKLKIMHQTLKDYANELNGYLEKKVSKTGDAEIEISELMSNYTLEVIGAIAMGIKCTAIHDPECEFKKLMLAMFQVSWRTYVYIILEYIHPKLPILLKLTPVRREVVEFMKKLVKETIAMKESDEANKRKDFLQLVMSHRDCEANDLAKEEIEADPLLYQENRLPEKKDSMIVEDGGPLFSENLIIGTMITFLSAGFEPVSSALTFCLYELAHHPDIQEKIFQEIQAVKSKEGDDISYESMKNFKYTDQVIWETIRRHPIAGLLARICTEPFVIPDTLIVVEKGTRVFIDTFSLHTDPKYFPEPDKFDPDRFSEENRDKIVPGSYLPFGDGPRFCIAMRLATLDVKTCLVAIVSKYILRTSTRTMKNIKYDKRKFLLTPDGPVWLRIEKRI